MSQLQRDYCQRKKELLQSSQWTDCTFVFESEMPQVKLHAHKIFLSMASPVFASMFYGGLAENSDPILIMDVEVPIFRRLLLYIYTYQVEVTSVSIANKLYYAADKYMITCLAKTCSDYIMNNIKPQDACEVYELADLLNDSSLRKKCLEVFSSYTNEIISSPEFNDVNINTVLAIFSIDKMNITEVSLFDAAVKYAESQGSDYTENTSSLEAPGANKILLAASSTEQEASKAQLQPLTTTLKEKEQTKTAVLDLLFKKIRFLTMTPEEFTKSPAKSPYLTQSNKWDLLQAIITQSDEVPNCFSNSQVYRSTVNRRCRNCGASQ